eukprot:jgi/Psemu1/16226/gm1.16226_g
MDEEGGAMEQQQIHFNGQMEAIQGLHDGMAEAVDDPTSGTEDEGKNNGMTRLLMSNMKTMEGSNHTEAGMEGNNQRQNNTNEDEEDSYVSSDSSFGVKNSYPMERKLDRTAVKDWFLLYAHLSSPDEH